MVITRLIPTLKHTVSGINDKADKLLGRRITVNARIWYIATGIVTLTRHSRPIPFALHLFDNLP